MISQNLDVTADFNANNGVKLDLSKWETATFDFVTPSGTISITGTDDPGAIEGVTDGNALTSTNYTTIQAIKMDDGTAVTSVTTAGLYRITLTCKFIQFAGASAAATRVNVFCTKPY